MRLSPVLALAISAALVAGCSGDGDAPPPKEKSATTAAVQTLDLPPALQPAFSAPALAQNGRLHGIWSSDDLVVLANEHQLVAYDAVKDESVWTLKAPRGFKFCALSQTANSGGIAAVRLSGKGKSSGRARGCATTAAVDLRGGRLLWRHTEPLSKYELTDFRVSVSETTVQSSGECGEVLRFEARGGRQLDSLAPKDDACDHDSWHDSKFVAVVFQPLAPGDVEVREGWIHDSGDSPAEVQLWDADTGRQVWERAIAENSIDVHAISSDEPMVWDAADAGHRHYWTVKKGRFVKAVGPDLGQGMTGVKAVGVADGTFVSQTQSQLFSYDLTTGEEVLAGGPYQDLPLDVGQRVLGIDDDRIVVLRTADTSGEDEAWVESVSPRDPDDVVTLGALAVDDTSVMAVTLEDGRLDLLTEKRFYRFALPEDPATNHSVTIPVGATEQAGKRLAYDIAPYDCSNVSVDTLTLLGMHRPELPAPVGHCSWKEFQEPRYAERLLDITAWAGGGDTQARADADVARLATTWRQDDSFDLGAAPWREVPAEMNMPFTRAWAKVGQTANGSSSVALIVLNQNLGTRVRALSQATFSTGSSIAPLADIERAALSAYDDMAPGDASALELLPAADPGTIDEVPVECADVAKAVRPLTARKVQFIRADDRRVTCLWDGLDVTILATTGSALTEQSADEMAAELLNRTGQRLAGVGDEAKMSRSASDAVYRSHTLTVRQDNVVIRVAYAPDGGGTEQELDAATLKVARAILAGLN